MTVKTQINVFLRRCGCQGVRTFVNGLRAVGYGLLDLAGGVIFRLLNLTAIRKTAADDTVRKILLIRTDRIGDVVLSTPAIRAVRQAFPQAEILLLISAYTQNLVKNNPHVNNILIQGVDRLPHDMDLAIALHPGYKQNLLTFQSGATMRVGYEGRGGSFYLTHKMRDDRASRIRHEVESALELVSLAGCRTDNTALEICVSPDSERFAEKFFADHKLDGFVAAIHPGSRMDYIHWSREGFTALAQRLGKDRNARIILTGSREERALLDQIAGAIPSGAIVADELTMSQLVSVLKRCSVFIGGSTGPMHIAAACQVPVVAIFGPFHPLDSYQEWGPWQTKHVIVHADVHDHKGRAMYFTDPGWRDLISPEMVLKAVDRVLSLDPAEHKERWVVCP